MSRQQQLQQAYKLWQVANEQGRDDLAAQLQQVMQGLDTGLKYKGSFALEQAEEEKKEYAETKASLDNIGLLKAKAKEQGRDDLLSQLNTLEVQATRDVQDYESPIDEIVGASIAGMEGLTIGLVGDEAVAKVFSKVSGLPYEEALEYTRYIEKDFSEENPVTDVGLRLATGALPSITLARAVGVGSSFMQGALRQGGAGVGEVGIYSFMEGEGGVEERLENVGETLTNPLVAGLLTAGATVGGLAGRNVAKRKKIAEEVDKAIQKEETVRTRLASSKEAGVLSDVRSRAQVTMDNEVMRFYNNNGRMPEGTEITALYKTAADDLGVPVSRIFQSEMVGGGRNLSLDYRGQKIGDVRKRVSMNKGTGFSTDAAAAKHYGVLKRFWEDKIEAVVEVAKNRVGKKFGGNMQRMSTRMAQDQQQLNTVFGDSDVIRFNKSLETDLAGRLRSKILNFGNTDLDKAVRQDEFDAFKKLLTPEEFRGFEKLQSVLHQTNSSYRQNVFRDLGFDPMYFPSRFIARQPTGLAKRGTVSKRNVDENLMERKRGYLAESEALDYENPAVVLKDKVLRDSATIHAHEAFGLQNASNRLAKARGTNKEAAMTRAMTNELAMGRYTFNELRRTLRNEGASEVVRDNAEELITTLIVRGTQAPASWISNLRKSGYVGTIATPYTALLNQADVTNSVVNYGLDNTVEGIRAYLNKSGSLVKVDDVGLLHQSTGEFLREGANKWNRRFNSVSEFTFKASGFRDSDMIGKNVSLAAAQQRGRELATSNRLFQEYDWLFGPAELRQLRGDLLRNRKTQLVKEFSAAELGKLQPSDMGQLPRWYLDHPNGRILYMLRTFGIKQLQQLNRLVLQTWKEGVRTNDTKLQSEAIKNALAYVTVVGGGNVLMHELRQPMKAEAPGDIDRMQEYFVDFMLGLATLNSVSQYSLDKAVEGDPVPLIRGVMPPTVGQAEDIAGDLIPLIAQEKDFEDILEGDAVLWLPFMRTIQPLAEEADVL